jgi:hypothetical protein
VEHSDIQNAGISHVYWTTNPPVPDRYKITKNFVPSYFRNAGGPMSHLSDPQRPSNPALAVQLLNGTNPSRSVIDLPISIFELRELPSLIRRQGDNILQQIASGNLKYEFGIKPMIADIRDLLDFQRSVNNRVKLLKKLQTKTLCRKQTLYTGSVSTNPDTLTTTNSAPSTFQTVHRLRTRTTSRTVWGYVKYSPTAGFHPNIVSNKDLESLARKIVLGMTLDASTAWNALPWSWLADWYGNVGDWLSAHRNLVPCTATVPRICETTRTSYNWVLESSNIGLEKGQHACTGTLVSKSREIVSAALPSADLPFLTGRQVGILASLAASRSR